MHVWLSLVTLLCFSGKRLNRLFLPLENSFILKKSGLSHSGYHVPWATELQMGGGGKESEKSHHKQTRSNHPGTAIYHVLEPGAETDRIFFPPPPPNIKSRSSCLYCAMMVGNCMCSGINKDYSVGGICYRLNQGIEWDKVSVRCTSVHFYSTPVALTGYCQHKIQLPCSGYWAPTSVVGPWEHYSSWGFHASVNKYSIRCRRWECFWSYRTLLVAGHRKDSLVFQRLRLSLWD